MIISILFSLVFCLVGGLALAETKAPKKSDVEAEKESAAPPLLPVSSPGFRDTPEAKNFGEVCATVRIENRDKFDFTPMETRLLCGDSKDDQVGTPWAKVPGNQAAFFLRGFFQSRGHHQPEFRLDREILFVRAGPSSFLTRSRIIGVPDGWDPPKRRLIQGSLLTPELLDDLQSWTISQIKDDGYPCATATIRADPSTGESLVRLEPGEPKRLIRLETTGDSGLLPGALDRYNAFRVGDLYRERLVSLTKRRIVADGFLQNISMATRCEPDGAVVARDVILGPSRIARVGAGYSTEIGPRVRVIIRQSRIGASASSAELNLSASYANTQVNEQKAEANYRWYYTPGEARNYVRPSVQFRHEAQSKYDTTSTEARIAHGWNHEYVRGQLDVRAGPVYLDEYVARGPNVGRKTVQYADVNVTWRNHDHEFFDTSPRDGELIQFNASAMVKGAGANFTAQRFQLTGQKLWSIMRYDPPLFVLGVRFNLTSAFFADPTARGNLPTNFLSFIGGERDLRGFEPKSLPLGSLTGAYSSATSSLEGRFHKVIFKRADVFGFVDWGFLGEENFDLRPPAFMSPGLGLRWESPIGVLRTYAARRFALGEGGAAYEPTWRIGITYGEEF